MEIKYRPEIDGLRTIAVLSVIIYHAEFLLGGHKLLPGGFLGVDVFFVISGFLITSLMMKEFEKTGTISIRNFYERRARRLLPALLVVMLASMPFAWLYLLPEQLIDYAKSLISSLLFGSNFYWNHSLQQYGAESGLLKPFLHTWSLAVEEQYYIVFPLILLAIYKWCKSHSIVLLLAGLLLSLQFAEWMSPQNASFSFYLLPSRFWELLAGGLLANILHFHPQKENDALLNKTMPILGLFLIVHSVIFTRLSTTHPGFVTLMPVIGTILIIWFSSKNELVTKTLSSKSFVFVGLISYSLYLWHYPIFAFFRIEGLFDSNVGRIAAIALTFLLSMISVKILEKPFRSAKTTPNRIFIPLIIVVTALIAGLAFFIVTNQGFSDRYTSVFSTMTKNNVNQRRNLLKEEICKDHNEDSVCGRPKEDKVNVFVLGDSHGVDGLNTLITAYPDANFIIAGQSGCPPLINLNGLTPSYKKCSSVNKARFKKIEQLAPELDYIALSQVPGHKKIKGTIETINWISNLNLKLLYFGSGPRFKNEVVPEIIRQQIPSDKINELINEMAGFGQFKIDDILEPVVKKNDGIYLKKRAFFCPHDSCSVIMTDGSLMTYDTGHLTYDASKAFGLALKEKFPDLLDKN